MTLPLPWVPQPRFPWPVPQPQPVPAPAPAPGPQSTAPDDPIGTVGVVGQVGAVGAPGAAVGASTSGPALGPAQVGDWKQFLIWIAALAALWLILTAAQDAGYPQFANGMAGLILFGALLALGPKAIAGAQQLFQ